MAEAPRKPWVRRHERYDGDTRAGRCANTPGHGQTLGRSNMRKRTCSVEGCEEPSAHRAGYCKRHAYRFDRYGDPLAVQKIHGDDERRFWSKVDKAGPMPAPGTLAHDRGLGNCWLWIGTPAVRGYGTFVAGGRQWKAHQYALRLAGRVAPEGHEPDHLCRRPACCRPEHLEYVTHRENLLRSPTNPTMINALKTHCNRGHLFDEANTGPARGGKGRRCRRCHREDEAARR